MPETLLAGRVGRPHGLDGSFVVEQPSAALLAAGASVLVDGKPVTIIRRAGTDQRPIVRLEGCDTREDAERLRRHELRAVREQAPGLEEGEYWAEDLVGCRVADGARQVGVVRELVALPSCEALEIDAGPDVSAPLLIPLVADAIRAVDVTARTIEVDLDFLGES